MRNHPFNVLLLATGGLFIAACPNGNDTNRDANNNDALAGTNKDGPPNLDSTTPSSDAGLACCPSGSILYDCQEPGGGAGFACHNPALGCASSLTCGQGCDPQVSGRCQCVQTGACILGYHPDPTLCRCVPNQDAEAVPPVDAKPACIDNVLCIKGDHFDTTLCKCVPNQDAEAMPPVDAEPACVDNVLCIEGDHFDTTLCKCVPNQDAGPAPPVDAKPACIDNVLCIKGDHFDTTLCKCVPDTSPPTPGCSNATDCTGALPALCQQCADGSYGCAHFTCVAGQCQVAYCP